MLDVQIKNIHIKDCFLCGSNCWPWTGSPGFQWLFLLLPISEKPQFSDFQPLNWENRGQNGHQAAVRYGESDLGVPHLLWKRRWQIQAEQTGDEEPAAGRAGRTPDGEFSFCWRLTKLQKASEHLHVWAG